MQNFYYVDQNTKQTIIFVQGGPSPHVYLDSTKYSDSNVEPLWAPYMTLIQNLPHQFSDFNIAQVFQQQNIDLNYDTLSLAEAEKFINKSLELLDETIHHFKKLNHKIVLMGHSYGGFLIQEYLSTYGNNVDKIIIGNCRITSPPIFVEEMRTNNKAPFVDMQDKLIGYKHTTPEMLKLQPCLEFIMNNDYSDKLKNLDLSNMLYLTSFPDKWIGKLNDYEIKWAKTQGAKVIITQEASLGDFLKQFKIRLDNKTLAHNSLFYDQVVKEIKAWI